jgi:hypothetical protein
MSQSGLVPPLLNGSMCGMIGDQYNYSLLGLQKTYDLSPITICEEFL